MTQPRERRKVRGDSAQFATFHVGELFFGISALKVQEVIRPQEMTPIPLAPEAIRGLINLRGQIVPAVETRTTLGLPPRVEDSYMNIIVQTDDGPVSLLVDAIGDVLEVGLDTFAPVPENVPQKQRAMIAGVYRLRERLLLLLDSEKLVQTACH